MNETGNLWALPFNDLSTLPTQGGTAQCGVRRAAHALARWTGAICEAIAAAMLRRHLRRVLRQLDDRMLADNGINRADIDTVVRDDQRVLWRHVV
jgi:uncharacterized protein YjiS (DUF1127 family)